MGGNAKVMIGELIGNFILKTQWKKFLYFMYDVEFILKISEFLWKTSFKWHCDWKQKRQPTQKEFANLSSYRKSKQWSELRRGSLVTENKIATHSAYSYSV